MLWSSRSALAASLPIISWPSVDFRSRQMHSEPAIVRCAEYGRPIRPQSPSGASMRITRAPSSATSAQPRGPLMTVPRSRSVTPSKALAGIGLPSPAPLGWALAPFPSSDRTSSVCWPRGGAGPLGPPGVAAMFTKGPSCRVGPMPGTSRSRTLPLCTICGWSRACPEVRYGSAAALPSLLRNMSIHSARVFCWTFSSMIRSKTVTASWSR